MRRTTISVSDEEKDLLSDARMEMFGTDEVPYGVVIQQLSDGVLEGNEE